MVMIPSSRIDATASCRRGGAIFHGLNGFETLELRMPEIKRLVVARPRMCGAKRLRFGPRLEGSPTVPDRVRRIQRVIFGLWSPEQMEFDEARHLVEMRVARRPDMLERGFGPLGDLEAIHGDKHL